MLLSNIFSNRLNDLVDNSDKKDVINCCQNKNTTSPQLPATERNRVAGHSEPEERMEGAKRDMSDISFLYQGTIKYNWYRKKEQDSKPASEQRKAIAGRGNTEAYKQ